MDAELVTSPPAEGDVDGLHRICADPRVWTHYPSLRHTSRDQTAAMVARWSHDWAEEGLGYWTLRVDGQVIGYGGCAARSGTWNLGYRLAPEAQGKGHASAVARDGIAAAHDADPDRPVVALLLEQNEASRRVAERLGMTMVHRAPDTGNPDPDAVRLLYADRPLTPTQVAALLGRAP